MTSEQNPVKTARLRMGLTIDALADSLNLNRLTIIRTEQGCYTEPSPLLTQALYLSLADLDDYRVWQNNQRKANYGVLVEPFSYRITIDQPIHPLTQWRDASSLNAIGFCKAFCFHPATLHRFENQPKKVRSIPVDLLIALTKSGYSPEQLASFERAWDQFRWVVSTATFISEPIPEEVECLAE